MKEIEKTIQNNDYLVLKNSIKTLMEQKELVLIFIDEIDTERFSAGYIKTYSDNEILVLYVNPFGDYNGAAVKRIEDIIKIEYGGKYAKRVRKLNELQNENINFECEESENLFLSVLRYAQEKKKIVSIELLESGNEDVVGYVDFIEKDSLSVKLVNTYGEYDGNALMDIRDITHLICDSDEEKARDLLVTYHKK